MVHRHHAATVYEMTFIYYVYPRIMTEENIGNVRNSGENVCDSGGKLSFITLHTLTLRINRMRSEKIISF